MKLVAVTADDFGLSAEVNEAVRRAHREGILTCASLMIGAPAAQEAVALARAERLPVGVHLTLVDGRPVVSPELLPDLVDRHGRFRRGLAGPGARIFFSARARCQAAAECEAQVRGVIDAGLTIDHLNGHHHFHIHPTMLDIVIDLVRRYRIPAVRVPVQRGLPPIAEALGAAVMAPWALRARRRLRGAGIATNDVLFGLHETGAMTESAWLRIASRLQDGFTEVYCHPATATRGVLQKSMPRYRHAEELAALLSPRVREALDGAGVRRIAFAASPWNVTSARGRQSGGR